MAKKISIFHSIGGKIILTFSCLAALSLLVVATIAINKTSAALMQEAFAKLSAVQAIKKTQLEVKFTQIFADLELAAGNLDISVSINKFITYHDEMAIGDGAEFDISSSHPAITRKYNDLYSETTEILAKYSDIYGYYDLLLICQEHGHVMYSLARENDLGTNLSTGKYRHSHLAKLWQKASSTDEQVLTDIKPYAPSGGKPAMFFGRQIISHGKKLGILAFQLSFADIDEIMQERTGLGQSGETILVGSDKRMRSNSFFDPVGHSIKASFAGTVDRNGVDTVATREALAGKEGQKIITDYRGERVLVSYAPFSIYGLNWAIIAKIDEAEVNKPIQTLITTIVMVALGAMIAVIMAAIFFSRFITRPLLTMERVTQKISHGDFATTVDIASANEIGALGQSINTMTGKLQDFFLQNETQAWLADGLSQISQLTRGATKTEEMANDLCRFFANYLNCQIITFYILKDDSLKLIGGYAFNKLKKLGSTIVMGEGFVGQAANEQQLISISNIPEDYIRINSSIGDARPTNIVVVPFLHNNEVKGVMELGSFAGMSDEKRLLLDKSIEPIGIALHTINEQIRVKQLLADSQSMTEELQAQQEELRAANEDLEEQTQLLRASEEELKQQSEELRVSNEELAEKQRVLIKQKDEVQAAKDDVEIKARELALASKYKSEFLANMSHELRTPLNSLLLLSQSLMENNKGHLDAVEVEDAKVIYEGGNDLLNLINDIMDLSKVEAGKLQIHFEEISLAGITSSLHKTFDPIAGQRQLLFETEIAGELGNSIICDGQRLEQILKNFLSNAMKFTEHGSVTLKIMAPESGTIFRRSTLQEHSAIAFSVIDTGVGIPDDKQQAIFEAFQQEDGSTSRKYGGTGLGLTISREMARLLGGEIILSSTQGQGSNFTLFLPRKGGDGQVNLEDPQPASDKQTPVLPPEKPQNVQEDVKSLLTPPFITDDRQHIQPDDKTLLIIEDDERFAKILRDHGRDNGYKCLVAAEGRGGISLAMEFDPDGIVLDIGLPDIDGHQVLEQLKFSLKTRHIPVQIISAFDENKSSILRQGAIGYLNKPVTKEQLDTVLAEITERANAELSQMLVIENDEANQRAICNTLSSSKIEITCVASGKKGCEEILSGKYDCVILDLGLVDMNGFDVLEYVHKNKTCNIPPIIIYTGRELSNDEQAMLNKYSSSIIIKGAESPERLLDEVTLFMHKVESSFKSNGKNKIQMLHDADLMLKERRILLVDDDMRNSYALSKKLIDVGLNVEMANDGQQAVEWLVKDDSFELVLMDIMMPIMDGYEATRKIRKMEQYKNMPIIALTAKAMPEDRDKCLAAGASEYLTKPIDFDKLLSMLRIWLFKHA